MDEGKPAKATWWSRPRAHDPEAGPTPDHPAEPAPPEYAGTVPSEPRDAVPEYRDAVPEPRDAVSASAATAVPVSGPRDAGVDSGAIPEPRGGKSPHRGGDDFELERPAGSSLRGEGEGNGEGGAG
ncbi:MAG: hypothetical protein QOC85_1612, partial [Streptomyces sp.]|nr:hypothetical protein [Streptomyces sp.]